MGSVTLECFIKSRSAYIQFQVVETKGLEARLALNLIKRVNTVSKQFLSLGDVIESYPTVFDGGLGRFPGQQHISLLENARPVVQKI